MRDFTDDYGILPMPKYDEKQEGYYTLATDSYSQVSVPVTCEDTEMVSAFLEMAAEQSYKKVTPAYFDTALKGKYMRDSESGRMLDIIVEGAWYDYAVIHTSVLENPVYITRNAMQHKEGGTFASMYASSESAMKELLAELLDKYKNQ